ncbi:MAG TPA: ABC transporter permease [Candidatus Methylomirabilis sp.]|nr:ABC transporter permease [Candidatus Methylomirabilis sp.]
MASPALAILVKETRELVRDPLYLGLALVIPVVLMVLFGYGLSADVKHVRVAVLDHDRSPWSRQYIDAYIHSEYFDFMGLVRDEHEADEWLRSGHARAVIDIPPSFARDLAGRGAAAVGVTVDGAFPTFAEIIEGYVNAVNAQFNQQFLPATAAGAPVTLDISVWYNPALESKNFIVPGMLVLLMQIFPAMLGALLITREKESGTIFTLYASPASRADILFGKAVPYVVVTILDYLIIFAMSIWLFEVRFIGSFWVLSAAAVLYAVCTVGVGLLISAFARTQLAAMLIAVLGTVTPAFNLSGFIAPVASQDLVGRIAGSLIPATYFMEVSRGTYLKGLGFEVYWRNLLALAAYATVVYSLAWWRLRKRIG